MAGLVAGDSSRCVIMKSGPCNDSYYKAEESESLGSGWYFSRKEIEENSPSRRDGIDLKKEAYLRKSYCTFLQDLGMRLKVPQVTIASAIVFCHRFFIRQSHAKNDRRTIATVCMFLAGKVEETPRPLKDVIIVSYEIIHKKDPSAVQKIKQKDVYEQQKELILLGERVVLTTLGFNLNVHHPYKPLVEAIKKFKVAQNSLAQVAWNFVNDGLRTSLCLQFKPHHIAAGAIFLAAKFLKVKLPSDGDKVWWQEFDVTPRQLEDVSNQMLELYEQNRPAQLSHPAEAEGSSGGGGNQPAKTISTGTENSVYQDVMALDARHEPQVGLPHRVVPAQLNATGSRSMPPRNQINDNGSGLSDHDADGEGKNMPHRNGDQIRCSKEYEAEDLSCSKSSIEQPTQDELNDKCRTMDSKVRRDEPLVPQSGNTSSWDSRNSDAIPKIDKEKVRAALEKRRKLRTDVSKKTDVIDEDDLIERELESGIEVPADDEKRNGCPEPCDKQLQASRGNNSKSFNHGSEDNGEEGELSSLEEHEMPSANLQKNKGTGWPDGQKDHKRPGCEMRG